MREEYLTPEVEIVKFSMTDVIVTSSGMGEDED